MRIDNVSFGVANGQHKFAFFAGYSSECGVQEYDQRSRFLSRILGILKDCGRILCDARKQEMEQTARPVVRDSLEMLGMENGKVRLLS